MHNTRDRKLHGTEQLGATHCKMMIKDQAANIALLPKELRRILCKILSFKQINHCLRFLELTVAIGSPLWLNRIVCRLFPIQKARTIISPEIASESTYS